MRRFLTGTIVLCMASGLAIAADPTEHQRRPLGEESRGSRSALTAPHSLAVGAVSHLLLPTSANVNGQFGAVFKTKVSVFNAVNASYSIRAGLSTSNGEIAHTFISVAPGQTVTFNNILADLFGYSGGGAIDLDSNDSNHLFIVNSQVYVDTLSGRYTTAVQFADDLGDIVPSRPGFVVGVSINSARRTNIGCASNSGFDQTITFRAFDADNFAVGNPFSFPLAAFGWAQFGVNLSLTNGGIRIDATQNAACFAVEVDNISNDGTYQLATPF
ncbi:MAG TPA: hypothetical protein VFZ57_10490 [Thermoanaerobaculia bacterium]|nr:hypothetical protein [Thermoanaerobaculia bacterium]